MENEVENIDNQQGNGVLPCVMPCLSEIKNAAFDAYLAGYENEVPCQYDKGGNDGFIKGVEWLMSYLNKA